MLSRSTTRSLRHPYLKFLTMKFDTVRSLLEDHGELIVVTDAGQEFELHLSDVRFPDDGLIQFDAGDQLWYLSGDCIETVLVHASGREAGP